jgi:hypothetical protein
MVSLIVIHPEFESHWPFVAEHFKSLWQRQGETDLVRLAQEDGRRLDEVYAYPQQVSRLACLGAPVTVGCLESFTSLKEATFPATYGPSQLPESCRSYLSNAALSCMIIPVKAFGESRWQNLAWL